MSGKPLPVAQIAKLADDIREIRNYAENHGFDTSLVQASVSPTNDKSSWDWPAILLTLFTVFLLLLLSIPVLYEPLPPKITNLVFVIGAVLVVGASASAHKKFENMTITCIVSIGLVVVLLVGSGVFTPREAADRLQELRN